MSVIFVSITCIVLFLPVYVCFFLKPFVKAQSLKWSLLLFFSLFYLMLLYYLTIVYLIPMPTKKILTVLFVFSVFNLAFFPIWLRFYREKVR